MTKKRVLMLCYYFPPLITSGVARSLAFSRHLPEFGWEPTVLSVKRSCDPWVRMGTHKPSGVHVVRTPEWNLAGIVDFLHALLLRLFRAFGIELQRNYLRDFLCIPDTQIAWCSTLRGIILARGCDVVYASCSPFSSAISGCLIKLCARKPLVVDFRDAWSLNPHTDVTAFHRIVVRLLERLVVSYCDALVVNSPGAARLYQRTYPARSADIVPLPNGYDQLTPATVNGVRDARVFRILHAGSFYGSRTPDLLLEALTELRDLPIEFVQLGDPFPSYERFKDKIAISLIPTVERDKAVEMMQTASLLYLKQGVEPRVTDYIAVAAKTYEYLATGLPILAEVPPGDNADVVLRYAEHPFVVSSGRREDLKQAVSTAFHQRERLVPRIKEAFIKDFDRRALTGRLAQVFERVTA